MNRKWTYSVAALALALVLLSTGCQFYTKLQARDHLNKGVQAFRSAKYSAAIDNFKEAIRLDPSFSSARLYLAVAYFQQWVPGTESPDNLQYLQSARDWFNDVLSREPDNAIALEYMAQLNYSETQGIADLDAKIKKLDELGLPKSLRLLTTKPRGFVIVTGPTGSGKSTTLAAMIDEINETRYEHIMTIEDPIEFLHRHKKCMVNQREVGTDTHAFNKALRSALRQDPDVILVGEMRDTETIGTALTAAETGHLVFATLHTQDAPKTIDRVIDVFPPHQQEQVRVQLSTTLMGVVTPQPIPTYPYGFPFEVIDLFMHRTGRGVIGNKVASAADILLELGQAHVETGKWIVYTSTDSAFQLAAHEDVIPLDELYEACLVARELLDGKHKVGRVIARPFRGENGAFDLTPDRRDFALEPRRPNYLTLVHEAGAKVYAVGKVGDVFAGCDIDESIPTKSNAEGIAQTERLLEGLENGLVFTNLADTDELWGHRNDRSTSTARCRTSTAACPSCSPTCARAICWCSPPITAATRPPPAACTRGSTSSCSPTSKARTPPAASTRVSRPTSAQP